jgi:HPt (histidine-containing phosphotransfer) domain-containing protein
MRGANEEYLSAGMDDYITKPFQPALLLAKLERLAEGRPAQIERAPQHLALPVLNCANLEELRAGLPPETLAGLVTLFLHDAECQLLEIDTCEKAGDLAGIARQAHMLVSSAGNLGAMQTSALAREVEHFCRSGKPDGLAPMLAELRQSIAQSSAALKAWRDANLGVRASA